MRIRPFRRLWIVLGVASFGDWLSLLATAILASAQFTGSAAQGAAFGGTIAVRLLPALILGPIAGVLADRWDRRYTMVVVDLARFVLFASMPLVVLTVDNAGIVVGWIAIATFVIEAVTLIWIPAKEAAVPNLIPRARLEISNQLTLITTYGLTPVLAALSLSALTAGVQNANADLPTWADPAQLALWVNAFSRLATAIVVFFGIREIGGRTADREHAAQQGMLQQFMDGWRYIGGSPLVRGLVLGIFGAFGCGGIVVGTAKFFATSLGAGEAAFSLLFATLFIGLAVGIGLGPMVVRELSRRRWFGMSIVLASGSVIFLAFSIHLSMALLGALLVGAGAGMAFLAGTTLLGGEVTDDVRGRVFAVVQIGTRVVLMLAIALSGVLVGVGGSRRITLGAAAVDISSTRVLLLVAGVAGVLTGISSFRQMDDKRGVPVLADLWGSVRGRPLSPAEPFLKHGIFVVFEGGEGAGKSTQVDRLTQALQAEGRDVVVTREPGATDVGARIRSLVLDPGGAPSPRAEALLYAADRAHHVATVVRPAMARGAVVVSDRYVDSSLAYQGAGRTLPVNEISWLSSWATGGLKPDLVVLLDVEPSVGLARAAARGEGADRLEAESQTFHERVRYAFLDLAAADPKRYLVLDASRPADEIAELIAARVTGMLTADDTQLAPISTPPPPSSPAPPPPEADATQVIRPADITQAFDGDRPAPTLAGSHAASPDETQIMPPDATQVVPPDATQVVRPVEPRIVVLGPDATQVVPTRATTPDETQVVRPHAASADETQVVPSHVLSADETQVVPSHVPSSPDETQVVPPLAAADQESPTDVAVELTGRGTPVDPATDDGTPDDLARPTRKGRP